MKFKNYLQVIVIAIFTFQQIHGASILFYWPFATYSHRISVWALVERLVDEGHNVTFLASHPPKSPNPKVTEVSSASGYAAMNFPDFVSLRFAGGVEAVDNSWRYYVDWGITLCDALLHDPKIIEWIHTSSFDLVVINGLFNDCGYGLAHKFKAPYIMYGTTAPFGWWSEAYGYPDENYPEMQFHYPEDMTFLQRVSNALRPLYWKFLRQYYLFPRLEAIFRETLNLTDAPSIEQMERNVSLIFVNTHVAEEFPRALPPSVIPIGGMHCKESVKPLPSVRSNKSSACR
jgi:glucuronosyltransferase